MTTKKDQDDKLELQTNSDFMTQEVKPNFDAGKKGKPPAASTSVPDSTGNLDEFDFQGLLEFSDVKQVELGATMAFMEDDEGAFDTQPASDGAPDPGFQLDGPAIPEPPPARSQAPTLPPVPGPPRKPGSQAGIPDLPGMPGMPGKPSSPASKKTALPMPAALKSPPKSKGRPALPPLGASRPAPPPSPKKPASIPPPPVGASSRPAIPMPSVDEDVDMFDAPTASDSKLPPIPTSGGFKTQLPAPVGLPPLGGSKAPGKRPAVPPPPLASGLDSLPAPSTSAESPSPFGSANMMDSLPAPMPMGPPGFDDPFGQTEKSLPAIDSALDHHLPGLPRRSADSDLLSDLPGLPEQSGLGQPNTDFTHRPPTVEVVGMELPPIDQGDMGIPAVDPRLAEQLPGLPSTPEHTRSDIPFPEAVQHIGMAESEGSDILSNLPGLPDAPGVPVPEQTGGVGFNEESIMLPRPDSDPFAADNDPFESPLDDDAVDPFNLGGVPPARTVDSDDKFKLGERPDTPPVERRPSAEPDPPKPRGDEVNLDALEIIQPDDVVDEPEEKKSRAVRALKAEYLEPRRFKLDPRVLAAVVLGVVLLGVILGQTGAGYFGVNLFFPKKKVRKVQRQVVKFDRIDRWMLEDTPLGYQQALHLLNKYMARYPDKSGVVIRWALATSIYGKRYLINNPTYKRLKGVVGGRIGFPTKIIFQGYIDLIAYKPKLALTRIEQYRSFGKKGVRKKAKKPVNTKPDKKGKKRVAKRKAPAQQRVVKQRVISEKFELAYLEGAIYMQLKQYSKALRAYNRAIAAKPGSLRGLYASTLPLLKLKRFGSVRTRLNRVLKKNPYHQMARIGLARITLLQRKPKQARDELLKALKKFRPNQRVARSKAYVAIAETYFVQENKARGNKYLDLAYRANTLDEPLTLRVAETSLNEGFYGDALSRLRTCQAKGCRSSQFFMLLIMTHLKNKKFASARGVLLTALRIYPDNVELKFAKGRIEETKGRFSLAQSLYKALTQKHPEYAPAYFALADLLKRRKESLKMLAVLSGAAKFSSRKAEAFYRVGALRFERKEWAESEVALREAIKLDAEMVKARVMLGTVLMRRPKKDWVAALEQFKRVEKFGVNSKDFLMQFAHAYFMARKYLPAKEIYLKILKREKDKPEKTKNPGIYLRLGMIYFGLQQYTKAEKAFIVAKKDPTLEAQVFYHLGQLEIRRRRFGRALLMFKQALAGDPNNLSIHYYYAKTLEQSGGTTRAKEALSTYNYMVLKYRQKPELAKSFKMMHDVYFSRGRMLMKAGKTNQALADLIAALESKGNDQNLIVIYESLVQVYFKLGQHEKCKSFAEKLLKEDKQSGVAHFYVGKVYRHKEDRPNAVKHLELSLKSKKKFPEAYRMLAYHYRDHGNKTTAIRYFETYLKLTTGNPNYFDQAEIKKVLDHLKNPKTLKLKKIKLK